VDSIWGETSETSDNDASVYRSALDSRVWVPTMTGNFPVAANEAMSSTSLRTVKAYVEEKMGPGKWTKTPVGAWTFRMDEE
jgi:hypothetical protein